MDQRTHRCGLQAEIELRALANACAPLPLAGEPSVGVHESEAVELPEAATVAREDLEAAEVELVDLEALGHHVERGQALRRILGRRLLDHGLTLTGGLSVAGLAHQAQVAEARGERTLARLAPVELAVRAVALQVCLPAARIGTGAQVHRLEGLAEHAHLVGGERELRHGGERGSIGGPSALPGGVRHRRGTLQHRTPGIQVEAVEHRGDPHAGSGRRRRIRARAPERDAPAQRPTIGPQQLGAQAVADAQRDARLATAGRMLEHELRRPGLAGRLAEGRGQAAGEAGEIRDHLHPRRGPADTDVSRPLRGAGELVEQWHLPGRRQRRSVRTPRGAEAHRAVFAGLRGEAQRIAEQARLRLGNAQRVRGEAQPPTRLLQRRQGLDQLDSIVGEAIFALHPRVDRGAQGHHQPQFELAAALGHHAVGEAVDAARHRTRRHETQELGGRAARTTGDGHDLARALVEVGHLRQHIDQLHPEDASARRQDAQARALEAHLAVDALDARPAGGVVERGIGDLHADQEAPPAVAEGEVVERPLQLQARLGHLRRADPTAQPVARVVVDHPGEVTPHRGRLGADEARLQVDLARPGRCRPVAARSGAGGVGVLEGGLVEHDRQPLLLPLPAAARLQAREGQGAGHENLRQVEPQVLAVDPEAPALVVAVHAAGEPGEAGQALVRRQPEPGEARRQRPALGRDGRGGRGGRGGRALPGEAEVLDAAARGQRRQVRAQLGVERQVGGERGERRELEPLGNEASAACGGAVLVRRARVLVRPACTRAVARSALGGLLQHQLEIGGL